MPGLFAGLMPNLIVCWGQCLHTLFALCERCAGMREKTLFKLINTHVISVMYLCSSSPETPWSSLAEMFRVHAIPLSNIRTNRVEMKKLFYIFVPVCDNDQHPHKGKKSIKQNLCIFITV
jgi:hypothetical protein